MISIPVSPFKAVDKAYYKHKPNRKDFDNFKSQLIKLLENINENEGEEHNKKLVNNFFENYFDN